MMKKMVLTAAAVASFSMWACAQGPVAQLKVAAPRTAVMGPAVKGAPYSAEEVTETLQVLGDGTQIHNENRTKVFRDGEGRVRRETAVTINISDPVSGVSYFLDPKSMTARKATLSVMAARTAGSPAGGGYAFVTSDLVGGGGASGAVSSVGPIGGLGGTISATVSTGPAVGVGAGVGGGVGVGVAGPKPSTIVVDPSSLAAMKLNAELDAAKAQMVSISGGDFAGAVSFNRVEMRSGGKAESLGTQSIDGVVSQGTRNTTTIEVGAIGNDRALTIVTERWYSPELQTVMMTSHSDPRTGKNTFHLTNVSRTDPDPALFQLPTGYQLIEK